jgi:NAD dependent epimerase/dehydratase family enzyme
MNKVLIAGGSGSLGLALAERLAHSGYEVSILTRRVKINIPYTQILWDGKSVGVESKELFKNSIIINLAGELVDRVPTKKNIELLKSSRVEPTRALVRAAKEYGSPKLWLQMSTLAIYGDAGEAILTEDSPEADGPAQMAGVARAWEAEVNPDVAERLVIMRTAVVLQPGSPALNRLVRITKLFMGRELLHSLLIS